MQLDLEANLETDAELQRTIEDWPNELRINGQTYCYYHLVLDLCEDANNWLDALTLGREPAITMMGTSSHEDETECNEIVRKELLGHLDTPGMGIM